jgi:steroid 5-alpha reductase family enzyme
VGRTASLARIVIAYVVALAVAAAWLGWGPSTGRLWLDTLVADLLATLVVFAFSRTYRNSSFYDAYWSVAPPVILLWWWSQADAGASQVRTWLVTVVVMAWAVRLTANWVRGFPGLHHEDWRYPMLRERAGRAEAVVDLLAIHVFPTLQVYLAMLPVYLAVVLPAREAGWLDVVALLVGLAAVLLQLVADEQMRGFVRAREPGEAMTRGLWGWSRHPNYFGEITFWFSLGLFGLSASPADWWWLFAGAAAMVAMFLGASIPMMEQRSLERRQSYADVVERVPRLVPRPPRRRTPA